MALDPRLADTTILAMAAMRARERQVVAPRKTVTVQVIYYDALGALPDEMGERYVYQMPPQPGERAW